MPFLMSVYLLVFTSFFLSISFLHRLCAFPFFFFFFGYDFQNFAFETASQLFPLIKIGADVCGYYTRVVIRWISMKNIPSVVNTVTMGNLSVRMC